ncbi:MAG: DUF6624 domain-containing protein [Candidatus Thiodiazotropha sp.]
MREKLLSQNRLHGSYDDEMQRVQRENAEHLACIAEYHGWPGISLVGLEGSRLAWLIAQHSICAPQLQRDFLRQMQVAASVGDVPKKQLAMLTDRIRFNEGRAQVYGTVLDWDAWGQLNCAVENPEHVDKRRASVGLEPLADALKKHRKAVEAEGGKPPEDYKAYKAAATLWAEKVGWR